MTPTDPAPDPRETERLREQVGYLDAEVTDLRRRLADVPGHSRSLEQRLVDTQRSLAGVTSQNERLAQTIVELNRQTRLRDRFVPPVSAARSLAIVGALEELIRHAIHQRGPGSIPELRGELVSLTAALLTAPPSDETREAA